jgi:hypothetical protein
MNNKIPEKMPWTEWSKGTSNYCCEMLVTTNQEGTVGDMLNYDYVNQIESNGTVDKIRHIKK